MPALLISGTNMRAGRGDSREDCSALFSVFTAEQEMRATCSMPCKQLLPGECTSSAANRQVNASAGVRVRFLQRGEEDGRIGPKEGKEQPRRETRDESGV